MLSCPPTEAQNNPHLETILASYLQAEEAGQVQDRQAWLDRYPDFADDLRAFFESRDVVPRLWPERPLVETPCRFGDYELLEEIARGGMGVVYKARQCGLNRIVALKMILAGQLASAVRRRTASTPKPRPPPASTIPTSCPSTKSASTQGQHYFSMKLIEGGSLAEADPGVKIRGRQAAAPPGRPPARHRRPGRPLCPPARHPPSRPQARQHPAGRAPGSPTSPISAWPSASKAMNP